MKKILQSLPFRLLAGVVLGILAGLYANEVFMNIIVTLKQVIGQVITFCVPLIIIGFIAPSITRLGKNASRMLGVALVLAYVSSIGAAFFAMGAGYGLIPHLSIVTSAEGLKELPEVLFQLEIPQIMSVMSALVFSIFLGLGVTWTGADRTAGILEEFQQIVLQIVTKVMLPECRPSLINGATNAAITILGYGAMAGAIGGRGLGAVALMRGYGRGQKLVMYAAVIILVILVQIIQSIGTAWSVKSDRRINPTETKRRT